VPDHGKWDVLGDPTEGALLYLGKEVGKDPEAIRKEWKLIEEIPFDSVTKRMTVTVEHGSHGKFTFTKGAPESIMEITRTILKGTQTETLTDEERKKINHQMELWARKGLRVLAFSFAKGNVKEETFLGMVAIHDAPRPEVNEAVARAKQAGIKVVMITGDNEKTAEAIGVVSGIIEEGAAILTGAQVESYSDEELLKLLPQVKIFARTSPFHKHRIVKLYQKLGEIVAVTGDGVNDAIALKQADVGVAMGLVGTDVARETADMVITDDNFASIVNAVEEGRNIIKNLKNAIKYLLSCNIMEAFALIGGLILGFNHIFYPIQLLYINLVTDGVPALALAFSPRNSTLMQEKPDTSMQLIKKQDQTYIFFLGLIGTVIILGSFLYFDSLHAKLAYTAAFSILTLIQSFILVDLWLSHQSLHTHLKDLMKPIFFVAFLFPFVAQYIIATNSRLASWFKVVPVEPGMFLLFVLLAATSFAGIKVVKKFVNI
jgi:Ca2+-transporting ATPase